MHDNDKEIYGIFKMTQKPPSPFRMFERECIFTSALNFWKSVEEKYNEKKRIWMETDARMVAVKLAAVQARRNMEQVQRIEGAAKNREMTVDELFGVATEVVTDPGDRVQRSFVANTVQQIRNDLMNRRAEADLEERKTFVRRRRILLAIVFAFFLLIGGLFILNKIYTDTSGHEAIDELSTTCKLCKHWLVHDLIRMVYPSAIFDD